LDVPGACLALGKLRISGGSRIFERGAGIKRHRREDGVWEGGISLPTGVGSGEGAGAMLPPKKIFGLFIVK